MPSRRSNRVIQVSTEATSTVAVVITSLRASAAVAIRVSDWMMRPIFRLSTLIHSLTQDGSNQYGYRQPAELYFGGMQYLAEALP